MTNRINNYDWYEETFKNNIREAGELPPAFGQPDMAAGGPPMDQPGGPGDPMGQNTAQPNLMSTDASQNPDDVPDISNDPQYPDMPEEQATDDYEVWRINFIKESIKGNPNVLVEEVMKIRDRELDPAQRKFVEDNLDLNFLRQNSNIFNASRDIRRKIKTEFDRLNPSNSLVNHIVGTLEEQPLLNNIYIKLLGLGGGKMDSHRKFVGSLIGAVQVGSGGQNEDLVFEETDYSIRISTRFNTRWGDVNIGRWYLKSDDPERFLKDAEIDRLEGGSPEEKDVLRRRIVIESIAEQFLERSFIINVVNPDGSVQHLGLDLGNCLRSAFLDGKLVVRTNPSNNKEAFIDEEGSIISVPHLEINYIKERQEMDSFGNTSIEEVQFMEQRDGMLYLTATIDLIKESSVSLKGMLFKESLWNGNPTDLLKISRCVPSSPELLLRVC